MNPGASFLCKESHLFMLFPPSQFQDRPQARRSAEAREVGLEKTSQQLMLQFCRAFLPVAFLLYLISPGLILLDISAFNVAQYSEESI